MRKIYMLSVLSLIACGENNPQTQIESKTEKVDYKVVQLDFNYLNYLGNIKPNNESFMIRSRNLIIIDCNTENYTVDGKEATITSIGNEIKAQLEENRSNEDFPPFIKEKHQQLGEIEYPENYSLLLLIDPNIDFGEYQDIRKEIFMAINDLRNKLSLEKVNKNLFELIDSQDEKNLRTYEAICKIYPMNYTESIVK